MANPIATIPPNFASGIGWWADCTLTTTVAITGTSTASTTVVYTNTSARMFQPSLPVACMVPALATATSAATVAYNTLQGANNNNLPSGWGVNLVVLGTQSPVTNTLTGLVSNQETGTLTIGFVNVGATSTLTSGTRLIFLQTQGN